MRPTDMRNLAGVLTALTLGGLLAGCASTSGSSSSAAGDSLQSGIPSGNPSAARTSPAGSAAPSTTGVSTPMASVTSPTTTVTPSALPTATAAPSALPTVAGVWVPPGAKSATLSYTGAVGAEPITAHKTVTGATFQRLSGDLNQLTVMPAGRMQCNIATGESATITVSGSGRTLVFTVPGVACRGVRLTINGTDQTLLIGSTVLLSQIRNIVGYTGMSHPLNGSTLSH